MKIISHPLATLARPTQTHADKKTYTLVNTPAYKMSVYVCVCLWLINVFSSRRTPGEVVKNFLCVRSQGRSILHYCSCPTYFLSYSHHKSENRKGNSSKKAIPCDRHGSNTSSACPNEIFWSGFQVFFLFRC